MSLHVDTSNLGKLFRPRPGKKFRLRDFDPGWMGTPELKALGEDKLKKYAKRLLRDNVKELADAEELLWASDTYSVLIILQGMDASGKDGAIKHVMSGLNPQGCSVHSFKEPSAEELDHTFLWRYMKAAPERGKIAVFNRSHYEDVLVPRVVPEVLERSKLPAGERGRRFWLERYDDINRFERHLARNGTVILKLYMNLSKREQRRRLLERLDDRRKNWKFAPSDLRTRERWDDYMHAYEEAIAHTNTPWAPWWIVPADHKFVARVLVATVITKAITSIRLRVPRLTDEQRKLLEKARRELKEE